MLNLYSLEQLALDRQAEMTRRSLRHSLLRQAANAPDGVVGEPVAGSSVRSRVGLLLVRAGIRLGSAALPLQGAAARRCLCVPVGD